MLLPRDPVGAFMTYEPVPVKSAPEGPLAGLTMAVKDIYDVAGYRTGCGNPTKLEDAEPANDTAPIVQGVLDAGARFVGKTITDELAFSLNGKNAHYGTPVNTRAPDRVPGGSSCGSASAVAAGLCDFAFGSDTGGSVRAPASYCGLYGLRPTFGRLSLAGCMPLAKSFDTPGWFARDIAVFSRIADVLLGDDGAVPSDQPRLVRIREIEALMLPGRLDALSPAYDRVLDATGTTFEMVELGVDAPDDWLMCFRRCQGVEAWAAHGDWIARRKPDLGPGVKERFEFAGQVTEADAAAAQTAREGYRSRMDAIVGDGVIVLPTVPDAAPLIDMPHADMETFRDRALTILCLSGLSGLPQMQMPLGEYDGAPLGLSLIGPRSSDRALVRLAARICGT